MVAQDKLVIGAFYEREDGTICRTTGWSGKSRNVSFNLDDGEGTRTIGVEGTALWTDRPDLSDFPNARDPVLPFGFDLYWDIKYRSQLEQVLASGEHYDIDAIRALAETNGLLPGATGPKP
jgi:hypothetical protein